MQGHPTSVKWSRNLPYVSEMFFTAQTASGTILHLTFQNFLLNLQFAPFFFTKPIPRTAKPSYSQSY